MRHVQESEIMRESWEEVTEIGRIFSMQKKMARNSAVNIDVEFGKRCEWMVLLVWV